MIIRGGSGARRKRKPKTSPLAPRAKYGVQQGRKNIRDERSHIADTRHQTRYHPPPQFLPMYRRRLPNDRSNTPSFDNTPNEEHDARNGCDDGLEGEEMSTAPGGNYRFEFSSVHNRCCSFMTSRTR